MNTVAKKRISDKKLNRRDILKYGLYGGIAAPQISLWLTGCRHKYKAKRPNIFLIVVDTLRADHLGVYGYDKNTSPNINQFVENARFFAS